jgi:hypothetical protein
MTKKILKRLFKINDKQADFIIDIFERFPDINFDINHYSSEETLNDFNGFIDNLQDYINTLIFDELEKLYEKDEITIEIKERFYDIINRIRLAWTKDVDLYPAYIETSFKEEFFAYANFLNNGKQNKISSFVQELLNIKNIKQHELEDELKSIFKDDKYNDEKYNVISSSEFQLKEVKEHVSLEINNYGFFKEHLSLNGRIDEFQKKADSILFANKHEIINAFSIVDKPYIAKSTELTKYFKYDFRLVLFLDEALDYYIIISNRNTPKPKVFYVENVDKMLSEIKHLSQHTYNTEQGEHIFTIIDNKHFLHNVEYENNIVEYKDGKFYIKEDDYIVIDFEVDEEDRIKLNKIKKLKSFMDGKTIWKSTNFYGPILFQTVDVDNFYLTKDLKTLKYDLYDSLQFKLGSFIPLDKIKKIVINPSKYEIDIYT